MVALLSRLEEFYWSKKILIRPKLLLDKKGFVEDESFHCTVAFLTAALLLVSQTAANALR